MSDTMVAVVTGANRGIGLAICKLILQDHSSSALTLYACSRSGNDFGLKANNPSTKILYPKLDVTSPRSIQQLASMIKSSEERVDILINNAGLNTLPEHNLEAVDRMLDTNYRGTLHMCQAMLPLMPKDGSARIVNMSSVASGLHIYAPEIQSRFRSCSTYEDAEGLAKEYSSVVKAGKEKASGWAGEGQGYCITKALVNAVTKLLARDNPNITINCCCPGWVDTDMGRLVGNVKPPKSMEDGARIPMRLAFGDVGSASGKYWANSNVRSKGDGSIQEW